MCISRLVVDSQKKQSAQVPNDDEDEASPLACLVNGSTTPASVSKYAPCRGLFIYTYMYKYSCIYHPSYIYIYICACIHIHI